MDLLKVTPDKLEEVQSSGHTGGNEDPHSDLKKYQDQLKKTQSLILETLKPENGLDIVQNTLQKELEKLIDQLAQERAQNSKLSADLSRSLELNLKLQFEVEEIRLKTNQLLREEQALNHSLAEKIKKLENENDLLVAINNDLKMEITKAKDSFLMEGERRDREKHDLLKQINDLSDRLASSERAKAMLEAALGEVRQEKQKLVDSLEEYRKHTEEQNQVLRSMMELAQAKMAEVQAALYKKTAECKDYQSQLQQALSQIEILKQENVNLREYFNKFT
ncbi:MAG: hypothetical protein NZ480_00175, partial [Bdellovibrionaceae bacterium]|nr:hypothetical protein [Pseudobdellovibrionaceae bacterium]MDW8190426.1 hypothetical protein [Pseudobdellovibrionaceae bacterium]